MAPVFFFNRGFSPMKFLFHAFVLSLITLTGQVYAAAPEDVAAKAVQLTGERARPSLFVTASPTPGLRTVEALRNGIQSGHAKVLWEELQTIADERLGTPVVTPVRIENGERIVGNRSYTFVSKAASRILDAAMVGLITEERRYTDDALAQIMALFDPEQWPEWSDQAHLNVGLNADLRHGQLVLPIALAYDWLYNQMTKEERDAIIEGLDRCAITPYKKGFEAKEHWSRRRSNWLTVVLGGFGIAGMALGPDHPDSALLVANSLPQMESYLDILGPEGEFNESVQYAGSMSFVVRYFMAMHYASGGRDDPFERHSLDRFYEWYMLMTFPPGRVAGFGDPGADMPPVVVPAAAVASATQNPQLQWFYEQYHNKMLTSHRIRPLELLYYDASLPSKSPEGVLPLGRAYHAQGHLVSSRSSWDPVSTTSVVYGKAGREAYHGHADWGQLCIDGYGERLVVDLGSPPGYPKSHTERYYNYQQFGHNVFVFGKNETGGVSLREKGRYGKTVWSEFDGEKGAAWNMDLSHVYDEGATVRRRVVHLLPRVAVVLDEARLPEAMPISLRWHLSGPVEPTSDGSFVRRGKAATLVGRTIRLDGDATLDTATHAYVAPYNTHRLGSELKQRNEPYVEVKTTDDRCRILTLFSVLEEGAEPSLWVNADGGWNTETPEGTVSVRVDGDTLRVVGPTGTWELPSLE